MRTRRSLLKLAAGWTAGSYARIIGANRRVRLGLIGCGGRGSVSLPDSCGQLPDVEFVAVCDVWLRLAEKARAWAGADAAAIQDFRLVLARNDIEAVVVATPDHWHAAVTILACQAGKHVYVEKPLAHNIREGRAMVEAARRTGRIVQVGTQAPLRAAPGRSRRRSSAAASSGGAFRARVELRQPALRTASATLPTPALPAIWIGPCTWARRRSTPTTGCVTVPRSAGSTTTRAASSPTTARTASTPCTRS